MALIGFSIISIFMGKGMTVYPLEIWKGFQMNRFWDVFAIFFPAVTGLLAGASMSGELKDPRKSIPLGTLMAILISLLIYVSLTIWFARNASAADLTTNMNITMSLGKWKGLVIAGIMGATLSSAISMFVSSPRILLALGKHAVLPFSASFRTRH